MDDSSILNRSVYAPLIEQMIANSVGANVVTDKNVYQEGSPVNKPLMKRIVSDLLLPGSGILGMENLLELHQVALRRKACLVLMEHYSNFDIPNLYELLEREPNGGQEIADAIVSVAGVKLNETSPLVLAFTEVFTRVVIYPGRHSSPDPASEEHHENERRRARINIAGLKALNTLRREGRLILVFPSGTRYKPWDPSTARGLKEIDTYIKFYSHMVTVAINGNTLLPNPAGSMDEDFIRRDVVQYTVSPVMKCSDFRREALRESTEEEESRKQRVVDALMAALARQHTETEKGRLARLAKLGIAPA
jgi:glycerol-3-phosphate O-acyltransferase